MAWRRHTNRGRPGHGRRDLVPFGGGVPLLIAGRLAGAVAVSGATSIQDHEIAQLAASLLGG
jgi:uncharacterized protein GlcG (DUF336 family)